MSMHSQPRSPLLRTECLAGINPCGVSQCIAAQPGSLEKHLQGSVFVVCLVGPVRPFRFQISDLRFEILPQAASTGGRSQSGPFNSRRAGKVIRISGCRHYMVKGGNAAGNCGRMGCRIERGVTAGETAFLFSGACALSLTTHSCKTSLSLLSSLGVSGDTARDRAAHCPGRVCGSARRIFLGERRATQRSTEVRRARR